MPAPRINLLLRSGRFDPRKLGGLQCWLDASIVALNGGAVETWVDRSGNGISPTQATAVKRPFLAANGIGGKPALQFDGVDDALEVGPVPLLSACPGGTIFIAHKNTGDSANIARMVAVLTDSSAGTFRLGINQRSVNSVYDQAGGRRLNADAGMVTAENPGYQTMPRIVRLAANWQAARFEKWVNGQLVSYIDPFQTPGLSDASASWLSIVGNAAANIRISEILIYGRYLPASEAAAVERYLSRKYAIALS